MHIYRVDYICCLNSIIIISEASYPPRNCQLKLSEADCNSIIGVLGKCLLESAGNLIRSVNTVVKRFRAVVSGPAGPAMA